MNILGCFIMGAAVGLAERHLWFNHGWGMFVTASSAVALRRFRRSLLKVSLLLDKHDATFAAYRVASFVLCIGAAPLGLVIARS